MRRWDGDLRHDLALGDHDPMAEVGPLIRSTYARQTRRLLMIIIAGMTANTVLVYLFAQLT